MPYKDPQKAREYWRKRYHENIKITPELVRKRNRRSREWYHNNKERERALDVERKYSLEYEKYLDMLKVQENSCAICKKVFDSKNAACVDHCHTTGKVRGILCSFCNLAIGNAKENIHVLETMISYLRIHNEK